LQQNDFVVIYRCCRTSQIFIYTWYNYIYICIHIFKYTTVISLDWFKENLQETTIFDGKTHSFQLNISRTSQSGDYWRCIYLYVYIYLCIHIVFYWISVVTHMLCSPHRLSDVRFAAAAPAPAASWSGLERKISANCAKSLEPWTKKLELDELGHIGTHIYTYIYVYIYTY
jgi:hypothetical protein